MHEEYVTLKWGDIVRIHGVNISKKNERKGLIISKGYSFLNADSPTLTSTTRFITNFQT